MNLSDFDDIRPLEDNEVEAALGQLIQDPEFISMLSRYRFPALTRFLPKLVHWLVRKKLTKEFQSILTIHDFQMQIKSYLEKSIRETTAGVEILGLAQYERSVGYLFMSNHRDISLDSALINYALNQAGMNTVRIGIGDNLLQREFATLLMRLNKSFIVKRSVASVKEMARAFRQLSNYIRFSIESQDSIWLAQREGRAKDGLDNTDPAILKMLYMAWKKEQDFTGAVKSLKIVPVSISYEYDPCDYIKARELATVRDSGVYEKQDFEDLNSIKEGITGYKGRVCVRFQPAVTPAAEATPETVATLIDQAIIDGYRIFPSNVYALQKLYGNLDQWIDKVPLASRPDQWPLDVKKRLIERHQECPAADREFYLKMYANPLINWLSQRHQIQIDLSLN